MTPDELDHQADAFADFYRRTRTGCWRSAFHEWARSKGGFSPADEREIGRRVHAELVARGIISSDEDLAA